MDTAVRTSQSGYLQRRLVNALQDLEVQYDLTVRDTRGVLVQFKYGEDGINSTKSDFSKPDTIHRIVRSVVNKEAGGGTMSISEATIDSMIKDLPLPSNILNTLREDVIKAGVSKKEMEEIIEKVMEEYELSCIEPCDAAGVIAAQSIGEPGTQMTMRTFHYAGVAEINVTLGLPRLIEIVDARKIPSTPMMTIALSKENPEDYAYDREKTRALAWEIEATKIDHIADVTTDLSQMKLIIDLHEKAMEGRNITIEQVKEKFNEELNVLVTISPDIDNQIIISPGEPSYRELLQLAKSIHNVTLKGIEGIKRVVVRKEGEEYTLYTEGSALREVLQFEGVDKARTSTNNINEIYEVLGIEAARNALIKEATDTLREQGLTVDITAYHACIRPYDL